MEYIYGITADGWLPLATLGGQDPEWLEQPIDGDAFPVTAIVADDGEETAELAYASLRRLVQRPDIYLSSHAQAWLGVR